MNVDSWTSEGMDWSSAETLKLLPLSLACEALRLAVAERLLAAWNASLLASSGAEPLTDADLESPSFYGGVFAKSFDCSLLPLSFFCAQTEAAMDWLLNSRFLDASKIDFAALASTQTSLSELPLLDEAAALSAIDADSRVNPASLGEGAAWFFQQRALLDQMDSTILKPGSTASGGGQRYYVEIQNWDSESSYYNLALGWAGLTSSFPPAEYATQGWSMVHASSGAASAFGSCDIITPWTRRQAWREWSKWTFDFGLLKDAGLDFSLELVQAKTSINRGLNETAPLETPEYSSELFPYEGWNALSLDSSALNASWASAKLTLEIGNLSGIPEIPTAPSSGARVKGWTLSSAGPFAAKFAFKFKKV